MWDDLDPSKTGDVVYYQSFATCPYSIGACLVVQFENYHHCNPWSPPGPVAGTFEVVLFEYGNVLLQYEDAGAEAGRYSTTGIENADGTVGLGYDGCKTAELSDGLAVCYRYPGAPPCDDLPWLSEQPDSGSVAPGECSTVTATFTSVGLAPGDYYADLLITSNDPDEREVTIPVSLVVVPTVYLPIVHKLSWPGE